MKETFLTQKTTENSVIFFKETLKKKKNYERLSYRFVYEKYARLFRFSWQHNVLRPKQRERM